MKIKKNIFNNTLFSQKISFSLVVSCSSFSFPNLGLKLSAIGLLSFVNFLATNNTVLLAAQKPITKLQAIRLSQLQAIRLSHQQTTNNQQQTTNNQQPTTNNKQPTTNCPTDLETLTVRMLKDLPNYANRVIQRGRRLERDLDIFSYILVAGRPEFEPLDLGSSQYKPVFPDSTEQMFFTTLEREHGGINSAVIENYHWLFLTETSSGWRLVMMFSRLGSSSPDFPLSPVLDSSNSAIAEGIRIWLRDCRANSLHS